MTFDNERPSFFDDVYLFHETFNLPVGRHPAFTDTKDQQLRIRLIKEELFELIDAHLDLDIVEVADAIADLIYVACGMAVSYGIPLNNVWDAVQGANMAKLVDGKPLYRADGKVLKPEGWKPPDIKGILHAYTQEVRNRQRQPPTALQRASERY